MELRKIFVNAGKVISSSGSVHFTQTLYSLIAAEVPFNSIHISEWCVDQSASKIISLNCLGKYSPDIVLPQINDISMACAIPSSDATVRKIIHMDDALLIHNKVMRHAVQTNGSFRHETIQLSQCNLVSRKTNRRYLISLCRAHECTDFSLTELCSLKNLSELLLPIVENHAHTMQAAYHEDETKINAPLPSGNTLLRSRFFDRIRQSGVHLSHREIEVCSALLTGHTVPEVANELSLKCSTIETYIKRAAVKLGVNGRHGLTKWVIE